MHFLAVIKCFQVSGFISCLLVTDKFFLDFFLKLYSLKNMKTLNYGQKVHNVYSPLTVI
jgi:hypothetical protein